MSDRLQKILSRYGVSSRRSAEAMIVSGRVKVNGEVVTTLGTTADPDRDQIVVDGRPLVLAPQLTYLLLHKPTGVLCTRSDPQGRKTIYDLLPPSYHHLFYVGRLDSDSSGALLLTNDGALTNRWTHPRHHIAKHYKVWVKGRIREPVLEQWRTGVMLDDRPTLPARVEILDYAADRTLLAIVLLEGRNRQIRRVAELLHHPVLRLHRTQIGSLSLRGIARGKFKLIPAEQVLAI
ncbi:MAG: pseudouridine synthase [Cyanobacteria bacterium M5B4]|nr:MAG: pseudouridine synthase [Cyanobacteria bacterium M5B4]